MSQFKVKDPVVLRLDPGRIGRVFRVDEDDQTGEAVYWVRFDQRQQTCLEYDLAPAEETRDPWACLRQGALGSASRLTTLLTWERIRRPPGVVGAAIGSARATLYPYQLKPLVRFLESANHRLLIADEVGLGKTVEAGYIIHEWIERTGASRILVLVPARLRSKWRDELWRRFGLTFEIVGRAELGRTTARLRAGQELEPFRWIASYEQLRGAELAEALDELRPPLDLVVLDEAHRARNRATQQHALARSLAACAQGMVLLTATPVQTGLEDLHALLDLLEEGAFGRADEFGELVAANRPVLEATQQVASGDYRRAAQTLRTLGRHPLTTSLAHAPALRTLLDRLEGALEDSRALRVELQSAISQLSLTSHVVTRTRKAEVLEDRPMRTPMVVRVELTDEERAVYAAVQDATRLLCGVAGDWGQSMAALTALRYTASCISAAREYLIERLQTAGAWLDPEALRGEVDEDALLDEPALGNATDRWTAALRARVSAALARPPAQDSKLQQLERTIREVWEDDRRAGRKTLRKIIVFSFFKRTLRHLGDTLARHQISHERIDGDVPLADREIAITRFLNDPGVNVLLSSEVGGEGLDLQAASVVVNYDLPWNPMVVEQRIGRVDRLGQRSSRIVVVNLVAAGTVEDRVLHRLYQRIGLFEAAIGEAEEILGARMVQDLVLEYLRGDLSEQEIEYRVEQTALAAEARQQTARALAGQVEGLMAADQGLLDQLNLLVEGHRLPRPEDIPRLLRGFLADRFAGSRLDGDPERATGVLHLSDAAIQRFAIWSEQHGGAGRAQVQQLRHGGVEVTAQGEVAMRCPRVWYLQARHPVVQFAVDTVADHLAQGGSSYAARVRVGEVPAGTWLVGVWSLSGGGLGVDTELLSVAQPIGAEATRIGAEAEPLLRALLDRPDELDPRPTLAAARLEAACETVQSSFARAFLRHRKLAEEAAQRRDLRRRATQEATLRQRLLRAERHLDRARQGGHAFAIRMATLQVERCTQALGALLTSAESSARSSWSSHLVAVILVQNEA